MDKSRRNLLYVLLAASGFSALVYEILWARYFSLVFGANMLAINVVTATFMVGLALGSFVFGRIADRCQNLLRLYALLELGIAAGAVLIAVSVNSLGHLQGAISRAFPGNQAFEVASIVLLSALLLIIPTTCMGGTLPVVCRLFSGPQLSRQVGRLYAINTGGAVAGALLSAFWLIPRFGTAATGLLAISVGVAIAVIAAKISAVELPVSQGRLNRHDRHADHCRSQRLFLYFFIAGTGMLLLGYEVLWIRLFVLFLGNSTYSFAIVLAVYLTGLALGGLMFNRYWYKFKNQKAVLFYLTALIAFFILVTTPFYDRLAYLHQSVHELANLRWAVLCGGQFLVVALVLLPPTMLSGSLFPVVVNLLSPEEKSEGKTIGMVFFANTVGAVSGSLVAGIGLIPHLGLQASFRFLLLVNLLLALLVMVVYRKAVLSRFAGCLVVVLSLLITVDLPWNPLLMNSGVYYYTQFYQATGGLRQALAESPRLIEQIEGLETTVAAFEDRDGSRFFKVNGKADGSSRVDSGTQILLGQLPMLLHPTARDALVIGLGTGITLDQVAKYPGVRVDVVEISPAVVKISEVFNEENRGVLKRDHVNLIVRDGRNLLLTRSKSYDVIVSEPSNPWQAGNANLFTLEFFNLVRTRLGQGGIFCQWLPIYDMSTESLQSAVATFVKAFPDSIAFGYGSDMILLGRNLVPGNRPAWQAPSEFPAAADDLMDNIAPDILSLLRNLYFGDTKVLRAFSGGSRINTDVNPQLEFERQMGQDTRDANFKALVESRQRSGEINWPFTLQGAF